MEETWPWSWPAETDLFDFRSIDADKIQARAYRFRWKPRIVFHTADAFFGNSEKNLSIRGNARGGIMHAVVVYAQSDHIVGNSGYLRVFPVR